MRKRYEIQRKRIGDDIDIDDSWFRLATVWATRTPARGIEYVASQQVNNATPEKFGVRWSRVLDDLTSADRLKRGSAIYSIVSVNNRNDRWLEIHAVRCA